MKKCVELPATTEGETKRVALASLKDAIRGYIELRKELTSRSTLRKNKEVEITVRTKNI